MRYALTKLAIAIAASAILAGPASAQPVVIGQFGNPTPMQLLTLADALKAETGWDVEWRKFDSGADVVAAMASGDVELAELGSLPLGIAASRGADLQMIAFSDVIGKAESLVARDGSGIYSLGDLRGKRIAVPPGSTAHYSLLAALQHEGLTAGDVTIIGMKPDQIAAGWDQGAMDAAWVWQPVQSEILKSGTLITSADQVAAWGFPTFDAWVVNRAFGQAHKAEIVAFLRAVDRVNASYLADPAAWTAESDEVLALANASGADPEKIPAIIEGFTFLPLYEQLSDTWLGGAARTIKDTAGFLKAAAVIDRVDEDYSKFVNPEFATEAVE